MTSSGASFPGAAARSFALGDTNGDGRLDVLVGNYANELLLQQSDGSFVAAAGVPGGSADTRTVALGDVDGNGRLDVPVGNYGVANELLICSSCPNGGAPLHATSACFACPSFIGRSSDSAVCRECPRDSISERVFGTGERCVIPCSLGERPLGFNTFTACKAIAGSYSNSSVKRDPKDSSTWAAPSCASCHSGKRADSATGAVCLPCVPGQFASNTASCDVCPAGSYSAGLESMSCTPCPTSGCCSSPGAGDEYLAFPPCAILHLTNLAKPWLSHISTPQFPLAGALTARFRTPQVSATPRSAPRAPQATTAVAMSEAAAL